MAAADYEFTYVSYFNIKSCFFVLEMMRDGEKTEKRDSFCSTKSH